MSVSTEVQRTLVKSPPELWSELSNPEALARHLSELGEVRITSVEPETKVEWESEDASGVVQLKQSGWGTRVTLSVTRGTPAVETEAEPETSAGMEALAATAEAVVDPEAEVEPESLVAPAPIAPIETDTSEPSAVADPEPAPEAERRPGFFARLFRRRRARVNALVDAPPGPELNTEAAHEIEIEVVALAAPEPIYPEPEPEPEPTEPASNLASELASMETQMTAETTELLTDVLDRLGAAHHRPFSRG